MKFILTLLLFTSCAQKYQTYYVIDKHSFDLKNYKAPITKKLRPGRKKINQSCEGQIFFMSNAKKKTDKALENMVRYMCPKSRYLLNTKVTQRWWTTIIYSRSCVELEAYCPR